MWKTLSSCAENARRISTKLDIPLPLWSRMALLIHLAGCQSCRRYSWQIRFLHQAFRQYARRLEETEVETLPSERRFQIKQLLRAASDDPPTSPAG